MVPAAPSGSATETDKEPNREKGRQGHGAGLEDCKQNSQTIVHDLYSGSVQSSDSKSRSFYRCSTPGRQFYWRDAIRFHLASTRALMRRTRSSCAAQYALLATAVP